MDEKNQEVPQDTFHSFDSLKKRPFLSPFLIIAIGVAILLGVGTGFFVSKGGENPQSSSNGVKGANNEEGVAKGVVIGSNDTETFKDTAQGELAEGGIEGEGQYHLVRPGGVSQNVYLTSSVVDLSQLVGRKLKVWGQTQKAQSAGWLMDVGRVEVLE